MRLERRYQYKKNREHLLRLRKAAGEDVEEEAFEDLGKPEELPYPKGSWICRRCHAPNFPKEEFCQYTWSEKQQGYRCQGRKEESRELVRPGWKAYVQARDVRRNIERNEMLPPSYRWRASRRTKEAKLRQRTSKKGAREGRLKASMETTGTWQCQ